MNAFFLFIASNLFVACFIACVAFIVGRSGRFATAAHWLWLAVFIKLITPPIVPAHISLPHHWAAPIESAYRSFIPSPASDDKHLAEQRATQLAARAIPRANSSPSVVTENIDYQLSVPAVCLIFSAFGTCAIIVRGAIRFCRFSKLLKCESVIDEAATATVKRLLADAESVPPVRRIAARVSPMLFGIGRSTCIVCPDRLWQTLDQADREAFLAHEVAHFQRRDHWVRWLEWIVTALYWWCPLVYVARQQLERHEEAACDAWAIASLRMSPRTYAEALLNVVDFLSETKVGTPRLASRMHPTDTLEERLRLIMLPQRQQFSRRIHLSVLLICILLLLLHPSIVVQVKASIIGSHDVHNSSLEVLRSLQREETVLNTTLANKMQRRDSIDALPPVPQGWWNAPPQRTFANMRLGDRGLRMLAEAGVGLRLQRLNGVAHAFDAESVCALAYVPSSGRVILGNADGELHLWDSDSSQSVSLIGKHHQAISSVAYHPQGGLVSGCGAGVLSKWDLQSGELLQNISLDERISSVRWAAGGDLLAVVIGNWTDNSGEAQLRVFSGRTFELLQKIAIPGSIAVVQQHEQLGWLAVDWSGRVFSLSSADQMFTIPKADVSGLVLCQELFDSAVRKITN